MNSQRGFTLVEVMIVVVIVAILSAIGIPSYQDYVRRGKITEAISALSDMRVKMEQFFQDNRTYKGAGLGSCGATAPASAKNFKYTCEADNSTYTVTATGSDGRVKDFTFTINQQNTRATTAAKAGWESGDMATCWIQRKGSC